MWFASSIPNPSIWCVVVVVLSQCVCVGRFLFCWQWQSTSSLATAATTAYCGRGMEYKDWYLQEVPLYSLVPYPHPSTALRYKYTRVQPPLDTPPARPRRCALIPAIQNQSGSRTSRTRLRTHSFLTFPPFAASLATRHTDRLYRYGCCCLGFHRLSHFSHPA